MKLDILDAKLIYLLGKNSRLTYSALGKSLGISREVVAFRLKKLQEIGFYRGTTLNINYSKLGMVSAFLLMRIRSDYEESLKEIETLILSNSNVITLYKILGKWDYAIQLRASSVRELAQTVDYIVSYSPTIIAMENFLVLDEYGPGWAIVIPSTIPLPNLSVDRTAFTKEFSKRTDTDKLVHLDTTDEKILSILSYDARVGILDLAKRTGVHYKTAVQRIKQLIFEGIIIGFDVRGDLPILGISRRSVFIKMANATKNEKKAKSFFHQLRECSRYWRLFGEFDFRLNLNTRTTEEFEEALNKIKKNFGKDIRDIECVDILREIKRSGFPPTD